LADAVFGYLAAPVAHDGGDGVVVALSAVRSDSTT
jgi:hypothetical protein